MRLFNLWECYWECYSMLRVAIAIKNVRGACSYSFFIIIDLVVCLLFFFAFERMNRLCDRHRNTRRNVGCVWVEFAHLNSILCLAFFERRGLLICEKEIFRIPADISTYKNHLSLCQDDTSKQHQHKPNEQAKKRNYFRNAPCLRGLIHAYFSICKVRCET